jgi:hypothetical protein
LLVMILQYHAGDRCRYWERIKAKFLFEKHSPYITKK